MAQYYEGRCLDQGMLIRPYFCWKILKKVGEQVLLVTTSRTPDTATQMYILEYFFISEAEHISQNKTHHMAHMNRKK